MTPNVYIMLFMTEDSTLKDIIAQMNREKLNTIVLLLAKTNTEIEKMVRNYSDNNGNEGIYKTIREQIENVATAYKRYDWHDSDVIDSELAKVVYNIRNLVSDVSIGIELLKEFFELDYTVCENFDTDGGLELNFDEAADLFAQYAKFYPDKDKLKEIINNLVSNDNYGCRLKLSKILI